MGSSFSGDNGDRNKQLLATGLSTAAGGFNAASGAPSPGSPQQPNQPPDFDFNALGRAAGGAIKKARAPKTLSNLGSPNVISSPMDNSQGMAPVPSLNVPGNSPMPDLYNGQNAQIPQLRKPINGMLPFYGQ